MIPAQAVPSPESPLLRFDVSQATSPYFDAEIAPQFQETSILGSRFSLDNANGGPDSSDSPDWSFLEISNVSSAAVLPPEGQKGTVRRDGATWGATSTEDMALLVVNTLSVSKRQLGEVFGVSRQTIYDWLRGTEPSEPNAQRLQVLATLIREVTGSSLRPLFHRFVTQPLEDGSPSILEQLRHAEWDEDRLRADLREARVRTTRRDLRHGRSSSLRPRDLPSAHQQDSLLEDNLLSLGED